MAGRIKYKVDYRDVKYPRMEFKTGKLLLVLPHGTSEKELVRKKKRWILEKQKIIDKAVKEIEKKTSRSEFLLFGKPYSINHLNRDNFHGNLRNLLKERIEKSVSDYSKKLRIKPNRVYIRNQKTKWGSCSKKGNLSFNLKLVSLPEKVINYVVFHELVHIKERKHNGFFWDIIKNEFDNFAEMEKELLQYWFYFANRKILENKGG